MILRVTQILWDTDDEEVELPKEMSVVALDGLDDDEAHEAIEDALAATGWCFKGYQWHRERP